MKINKIRMAVSTIAAISRDAEYLAMWDRAIQQSRSDLRMLLTREGRREYLAMSRWAVTDMLPMVGGMLLAMRSGDADRQLAAVARYRASVLDGMERFESMRVPVVHEMVEMLDAVIEQGKRLHEMQREEAESLREAEERDAGSRQLAWMT